MTKKINDFCIFIISHGRSENVYTWNTLLKCNNKKPVYIVLDNQDSQISNYQNKFGEKNILVFDKEAIAKTTDHGDNFWNLRTTTHARNACFNLAKELNYKYFLVLDDDYVKFDFRINTELNYPTENFIIRNINEVLDSYLKFYKSTKALSLCMSQGGDYIGGSENLLAKNKMSRKAMNTFFCSTDRPFKFISRLNEDVNTYMTIGATGGLFITAPFCSVTQKQTQSTSGGMTEAYLESGTYVKSFYTVMYCPSFTKVSIMGSVNKRLHHRINWNNAVPKIISQDLKK